MLEKVQSLTHQRRELDWVAPIDSTIVRVYQHGATLHRDTGDRDTGDRDTGGGSVELQEIQDGAA